MRQLVSVVKGETVSYFLTDAEGAEARQIAQLLDPGFGVGEVVETGVLLTQVLRLNGKPPKIKALGPAPAPELPPAPAEEEPPPKRKGMPASRVTLDQVVAYVAKHPGVRATDVAVGLKMWQDGRTRPASTVSNRLVYHDQLVKAGEPARLRYEYGYRGKQKVRLLYPV